LLLAILSFYGLTAYLGSLGQSGKIPAAGYQHHLKEPFANTQTSNNDRGGILGQYDAHVQPLIRWEKPGQESSSSHVVKNNHHHHHHHNQYQQRQRASTRTRTPAPEYTIELKEI
jgi:hypothetical protein